MCCLTASNPLKPADYIIRSKGEKVAARVTTTGTHESEFQGITPTGNEYEISGIHATRVEDGKFAEV